MSVAGKRVSQNGLRVFEAAARHLSFTAAARELRSTQSAVSQQVRALEEELGLRLFDRVYRGVLLTESGHALFASVQEGFSIIEETIERLQHRQHSPHVNILTDFSLAAYWLMPRLPMFRQQHPKIDVRILTSQEVFDWTGQEVDVAIMFCDERGMKNASPLFQEEVFPVCSAGFLKQYAPLEQLSSLAAVPLLTLTADQRQHWLDWPTYFKQMGGTPHGQSSELDFNNYTLLIQAAIAGQGVALGWRGLVEDMLERGMLVGLKHLSLATPNGYGIIDANPNDNGVGKRTFLDWIASNPPV